MERISPGFSLRLLELGQYAAGFAEETGRQESRVVAMS